MSNIRIVAKGIADADIDPTVKDCLQSLFTFELQNSGLRNPQYKSLYENVIRQGAKKWLETSDQGEL